MKTRITGIVVATMFLVIALAIAAVPILVPASAAPSDWTLISNRSLKAYPNLQETVWQKNATTPPNGPYDKIGLHRLIKSGVTPKGVVFVLPGAYSSGERLISNPSTDNFTNTENISQCVYWANRGMDVYAFDYRWHFIPTNVNASQLSFMAEWGIDQFISDIKEAVDKTKEVSGASKVFIAGISIGGTWAQTYAAKYWQQDIQGLILLDPANNATTVKPVAQTNSYNLTAEVARMKAFGNWSWENPQLTNTRNSLNPGFLFLVKFAAQNPGAPAQYPNGTLITTINPRTNRTWSNITEWFEYTFNNGRSFNTYQGYSDMATNMQLAAIQDRYYPARHGLDGAALNDYAVCPFFAYDYLAHFKEVNVPVLAFRSSLLGIPAYGPVINRMATTDFTSIVLQNYGHGDVAQGTYSARDVSQPALAWMLNELGLTPRVTAFCNATVMPGWTWNFFVHSTAGATPYTYQWYEGTTSLAGQTSVVLSVTKNSPGIYNFYCKVADSAGATANSNNVTLTVVS